MKFAQKNTPSTRRQLTVASKSTRNPLQDCKLDMLLKLKGGNIVESNRISKQEMERDGELTRRERAQRRGQCGGARSWPRGPPTAAGASPPPALTPPWSLPSSSLRSPQLEVSSSDGRAQEEDETGEKREWEEGFINSSSSAAVGCSGYLRLSKYILIIARGKKESHVSICFNLCLSLSLLSRLGVGFGASSLSLTLDVVFLPNLIPIRTRHLSLSWLLCSVGFGSRTSPSSSRSTRLIIDHLLASRAVNILVSRFLYF